MRFQQFTASDPLLISSFWHINFKATYRERASRRHPLWIEESQKSGGL